MNKFIDHYENHLAPYYNWIFGGWDQNKNNNLNYFQDNNITPQKSKIAVDLGCGSGFQSIPLAELGFSVLSIDLSDQLISELKTKIGNLNINPIKDNILNLDQLVQDKVELVICMGDTLTHLSSQENVVKLITKISQILEQDGKLILAFRDLTFELKDLDRFIPLRSDSETIFTCFLEYEINHVKVHDLIYKREQDQWKLYKSSYKKVKLPFDWILKVIEEKGLKINHSSNENGLIRIIAKKI